MKMCSFYYINHDFVPIIELLSSYLIYLLNINFEHVYIVLYSLNQLY
jgi:hypothetical protein